MNALSINRPESDLFMIFFIFLKQEMYYEYIFRWLYCSYQDGHTVLVQGEAGRVNVSYLEGASASLSHRENSRSLA